MKRTLAMLLSAAMVFALVVAGGPARAEASASSESSAAEEQESKFADAPHVVITYASQVAPTNSKGEMEQYLADTIYELTDGTVEMEIYWSASLFDSASGWEEVMAGTADATQIAAGTALDHFKIDPAISLFIANADLTFPEACELLEELYYMTPEWQAEWEGLIPINWDSSGGELYIMSNKPIRSLEDMKGESFRYVGDYLKNVIEAAGGSAVKMPLSEVTDSLSKGIICGTIQAVYNMKDQNFIDVCDTATGLGILSTVGLQRFMRADKFEEMNEAQQEAFLQAVEMYKDKVEEATVQKEVNAIAFCEENGAELIDLSPEDEQFIRDVIQEAALAKAAELDEMGYDGTGIYNKCQELIEKYTGK